MKVRCKCGQEWIFPLPFTTFEQFILTEHIQEHPHVDADLVARSFLGDINAQTDIEILEALWELHDPREDKG